MKLNEYKEIKNKIYEKIGYSNGNKCPYYFITLQYGFYDDNGCLIDFDTLCKYWDKTEVGKTVRLVRNLLRETFGISGFYAFTEQHKGQRDQYGDVIKKGRYHNHIITTSIDNDKITNPNRKIKRVLSKLGWIDKPLSELPITSLDEYKIRLLETCIQKADWVNRYSHSIKTEIIPTKADLRRVVDYCLKEFNPITGLDFIDIIDFANSDFSIP
jgi:hypothetical protein